MKLGKELLAQTLLLHTITISYHLISKNMDSNNNTINHSRKMSH
jgi:hypothetical protein